MRDFTPMDVGLCFPKIHIQVSFHSKNSYNQPALDIFDASLGFFNRKQVWCDSECDQDIGPEEALLDWFLASDCVPENSVIFIPVLSFKAFLNGLFPVAVRQSFGFLPLKVSFGVEINHKAKSHVNQSCELDWSSVSWSCRHSEVSGRIPAAEFVHPSETVVGIASDHKTSGVVKFEGNVESVIAHFPRKRWTCIPFSEANSSHVLLENSLNHLSQAQSWESFLGFNFLVVFCLRIRVKEKSDLLI